MIQRRRAMLLLEVLTVIVLLTAGGTLLAVGIGSMQHSQKRVAALGNRYAVLNDFLRRFALDVRRARTATLRDGSEPGERQILLIGEAPGQVVYHFLEGRVERTGTAGDDAAPTRWEPMAAAVGIVEGPPDSAEVGVTVTVYWHRTDDADPQPDRRFDLTVRCAGEIAGPPDGNDDVSQTP